MVATLGRCRVPRRQRPSLFFAHDKQPERNLRRHTAVKRALLALVAIALVSGCSDTAASTSPEPVAEVAVPWWDEGVLHADGAEIETSARELAFGGGTTLVGRSSIDGSRWWL